MDYCWYVGYGSNIHEQRFLCYINGGTPRFGKKHALGFVDKTCPTESKTITIPYQLYFALPGKKKETNNWGYGGVAFVNPQKDNNAKTFCRMWKISENQYEEVRDQEGRNFYDKEILLCEDNGCPVYTITSFNIHDNIICPSAEYIKTISSGLRQAYTFSDDVIAKYLLEKKGISGNMHKDTMLTIIKSLEM